MTCQFSYIAPVLGLYISYFNILSISPRLFNSFSKQHSSLEISHSLITVVTGIKPAASDTLSSQHSHLATAKTRLSFMQLQEQENDLAIKTSHNSVIRYAKLDISSHDSITYFIAPTLKQRRKNRHPHQQCRYLTWIRSTAMKKPQRHPMSIIAACAKYASYSSPRARWPQTPGSRIVNVSSEASQLTKYSSSFVSRFRNAELTFKALDKLVEEC